jgi:excisionase family DNA binding protein
VAHAHQDRPTQEEEDCRVHDAQLLTPEQVAARVQVAPLTVMGWLRKGKLTGVKAGRFWRIRERDLEAFLERRAVRPVEAARLDAIDADIDPRP